MATGFINLAVADHGRSVYRVIRLEHLYQLFDRGENVLVRPTLWDDPFENLRSRVCPPDKQPDVFGQCWTFHTSSDAMWRIYSPTYPGHKANNAVRIRSSVRLLHDTLALTCETGQEAFVGRVTYLPTERLIKRIKETGRSMDPRSVASALLAKRPAFRHERELRVLRVDSRSSKSEDLLRYKVDPHHLITDIMVNPRLSLSAANQMKVQIRERTGFQGPIRLTAVCTT